jgi:hypothetical protein
MYGEADVTVSTVMFKVPPDPPMAFVGMIDVAY